MHRVDFPDPPLTFAKVMTFATIKSLQIIRSLFRVV